MSNVVKLDTAIVDNKAWRLVEEINELAQKQNAIWQQWAAVENEIYGKTQLFDKLFSKFVKRNNYQNVPRIWCEFTSLVEPTINDDGDIVYYYDKQRLEESE